LGANEQDSRFFFLTVTELGARSGMNFGLRRLDAAFFLCPAAVRLPLHCLCLARMQSERKKAASSRRSPKCSPLLIPRPINRDGQILFARLSIGWGQRDCRRMSRTRQELHWTGRFQKKHENRCSFAVGSLIALLTGQDGRTKGLPDNGYPGPVKTLLTWL